MQALFLAGENTFLLFLKIGILLFLAIYAVFAAVIIKQSKIMMETLTTGFETYIRVFGYLHFVFAILVFVLAIFIL